MNKLDNTRTIPLNIFQTWATLDLPPKMKETVELLKEQNPEFTYYLYDNKMCRDFIEKHFDKSVLYSYDKLNPGAYQADLFRYCVLYIYGGIYLDIKYKCINNFKLIYLTDKEYFVRDRISSNIKGIYQALLVCYPNNSILLKCINSIVENVKNNYYGPSALSITGPALMNKYFYDYEIDKFILSFDISGIYINYNYTPILQIYREYRDEQKQYISKPYYGQLYSNKNIYIYPILKYNNTYDFTKKIIKNINNENITFYSTNPSIIKHPTKLNTYILNIRWVNYIVNMSVLTNISLNSRFELNYNFEKVSDEIFLEESIDKNILFNGMEDIRLFNYNNKLYYVGSIYDNIRKVISISSNIYNYDISKYTINKKIIYPNFYNLDKIYKYEKNWGFFNYNNKLAVVYSWYPIIISEIDYEKNILNIIDYKYNIPEYFKETSGSTPGYTINNEIWFVLHKVQIGDNNRNYQDFFAVFDLDMNLLRYSELFKYDDVMIQFCVGLIIEPDRIILSYGTMDNTCNVSVYSLDYINNNILWYKNTLNYI
jgi:mannosyltransferase OCH1-like enzyme